MCKLACTAAGVAAVPVFLFGGAAGAVTLGVPVAGVGSDTQVGTVLSAGDPTNELGLDGTIEYFIPLGEESGTYGVDDLGAFGTTADSGDGGGTLSMVLRFDPVFTDRPSVLSVDFEDLDIDGFDDGGTFRERLEIFDAQGNSLTGLIDDAGDATVTGDSDTQQLLELQLGTLDDSPLFLRFDFQASDEVVGTNTPEYLRARVSAVPLPAAGWLLLGGVGALGVVARRRAARG
jgi:hypothetical protein